MGINQYANGTYIDQLACVAPVPGSNGPYGYQPSKAAGIAFSVCFGISMILHVFSTIRYRVWWQSVFAVGALTEVIGWSGRTWSADCPYYTNPFLMQITTLIMAPAFFTAGIYIILGRLIHTLGRDVSPISPRTYLYIFCTADIISLVIQAVGGAMATLAFKESPPGDTKLGTNIMVGGIVFQLAAIGVFAILFSWVMFKTVTSRGAALRQWKTQLLVGSTVLSVAFIVIRSIYRTVELLQGWEGYLITTEVYFIVLDGVMMLLAVGVFNIAQPNWATSGPSKGSNAPSEMEDVQARMGESKVQF